METLYKTKNGEDLIRLVIEYTVSDGCTFSCTNTVPLMYESGEAFLVDFEEWCLNHKLQSGNDSFSGQDFYAGYFFENGTYCPPAVYTVDDWFAEQTKVHRVVAT